MAKKGNTILIKLANPNTGTYYTSKKNTKSPNTTEKLRFRKYDKKTRKHEEFIEGKL